jgi:lysozyme family protein
MTRDEAIALMLRLEGGEANLKGDPGGHTKYGITQRTLDAVRLTTTYNLPANVADLTPNDAAFIYRTVQWVHIRGNDLPTGLAPLVLNAAVNMGEPRAIMLLQEVVGVEADGAFGSRTFDAMNGWHSSYMPEQTIAEEYAAHAAVQYAKLYNSEGQFELGWLRRLFRVYTLASS